jgi:16S rRNA (uracil1498-N3)-methyltransferase
MSTRPAPRLYVAAPLVAKGAVPLEDDRSHYLLHVLRLQDGDDVRVFNATDGEWHGQLQKVGKHNAVITPQSQTRTQQAEPDVWLCPAPIKKAHFDYMIEKVTELGATAIQPVLTARTQIREVNAERCRSIAIEAAEQCERLSVPDILTAQNLDSFIQAWPADRLPIICAEWGDATPVHEAFAAIKPLDTNKIAILTGPEGGFMAEELEALGTLKNALFIRLGSRILRADTAAIAALAVWQATRGGWTHDAPLKER